MSNEHLELDEELEKLEEIQEETDDFNEVPPNDIVAFNELRSCADLLRMYNDNQLDIQPDFQREIVWSNTMQTRLIDSLVKQLPIPSLCISLDYKTQERFVIDGLQRIASIIKFLDVEPTNEWKLSRLSDIDTRISGKTNITIKSKYKDLFDKVQNTVLPITVLRCDYSKKSHMHYLFTIFHRLNTGGSKLSNQEIRNCIFNGTFNTLLKMSVEYENYIKLFNVNPEKIDRFSNEEMVLRFLSFTFNKENYSGQLARFLNEFMDKFQNASEENLAKFDNIFKRTIDLIYRKILNSSPLPKLSKATTEALFVGVAYNIDDLEKKEHNDLHSYYTALRNHELFSVENLKEGLAQKERVLNRLDKSIEIFG
ncbi:DUF262 domain-containing protein [Aureisphaera galaxeae]|uniref:DUF262 domain-containing protein n=1 Tax=Aureisphaera galaxeae TaxID=1538023 RepID=UPI0023509781|nr:DUF262 domain-containing protein [Aureisphaera galaxeae]MDC8005541.1 DUF262 domain-containing protein [Aureisphaera galaxeae]